MTSPYIDRATTVLGKKGLFMGMIVGHEMYIGDVLIKCQVVNEGCNSVTEVNLGLLCRENNCMYCLWVKG